MRSSRGCVSSKYHDDLLRANKKKRAIGYALLPGLSKI
jgi:hypothetical protein